jgi:superfamily II DNA or RNA helicase
VSIIVTFHFVCLDETIYKKKNKMVKKCTIKILNEVECVIIGLQQHDLEFLWNKFGIFKEGYRWIPSFQLKRWDGKIRFFDKHGKTYTKLLEQIVPLLVQWDYDVDLIDQRMPIQNIPFRITENFFFDEFGIKIRPYQVDAINATFAAGSGFLEIATGGGKSLVCGSMCQGYNHHGYKVIVIVPSSDLVTQTADEFRRIGIDVGEYSGDKKELDNMSTIATWQSLQNNPNIMAMYQVVIVDEAHGAKAEVVKKLINDNGAHIAFRFGVTGTIPKPEVDKLTLTCSIGDILVTVTSEWLIANGYLAEIEIEMVETQDDADLPDYSAEKSFLSKEEDRMEDIAKLIMQKRDTHGNTMVLVNSIQFGRKLQKMIDGSVIATAGIASTGISINRIFCLMLIDAGKSFIRAIQSVGRGLRRSSDKNRVYVVDVYSRLKYSKKHASERKKYYIAAAYPTSKAIKL